MNGITTATAGTDLHKQDVGVSVYIVQPIRIQLLQMLKGIDGRLKICNTTKRLGM